MSKLWYKQPANVWEEALPLGNGKIGAMIYGGMNHESIQLNEESMWYGGVMNRNNPDAKKYLPQIREYLEQGKIRAAQELMSLAMSGCPNSMHPYQTFGNIVIDYDCPQCGEDYIRCLELDTAMAHTSFWAEGVTYHREAFISRPAGCLIIHLKADRPGMIGLKARLERSRFYDGAGKWQEKGIYLHGNLGRGGVEFAGMMRASIKGGSINLIGESIVIQGADEAVLYFSADTTYHYTAGEKDHYIKEFCKRGTLPEPVECAELGEMEKWEYQYQQGLQEMLQNGLAARIDACMAKDYQELKNIHLQDFQALFSRVSFKLETMEPAAELPTDVRLERIRNQESDIGLSELLFDYGRYLLISSSRAGDLPANLQGIWNKEFLPPWDSKYTININLQMNYWHAESCNLSECHQPIFELLKKMQQNGRRTAWEMYGCRGFMCHHNTDLHGDTAPQDIWLASTYWVCGAAWLSLHLWTHYQYAMDLAFLKEAFPIMAEAALFFVDFMTPKGQYMVTNPSLSPENIYRMENGETGAVCIGAAMDNQILRDLFTACLEAVQVLGEAAGTYPIEGVADVGELMQEIQRLNQKLVPIQVGKRGTIMEWMEEYEETEPGHRHISHLYGLYPSQQITMDGTPELAAAARKTLESRLQGGGGHTGWSRAWIMNHYAKLWDGEAAYENIRKMLESSTYPNLFDKHPPFQIDGNFGAAAAIAQMLVQSSTERTVLLPALPTAWKAGMVKGLRLVGNGEIDIAWRDGKLLSCVVHADSDLTIKLKYGMYQKSIDLMAGECRELASDDFAGQ